uniref:Pheromone 5 n=1 Tax=Euplotoides octocarinatus TaxID=2716877 RepID=O76943_EUPOC|nr:pheromone 5 [Euplotes octocarinatus]
MKAIFIILAILMVTQAFKMTSKVNTKLQSQIQSKFQSKNKLASTFMTNLKTKDAPDCYSQTYLTGCNTNPDKCWYNSNGCGSTNGSTDMLYYMTRKSCVGDNIAQVIFDRWMLGCYEDVSNCVVDAGAMYAIFSSQYLCNCGYEFGNVNDFTYGFCGVYP